MAYGQSRATMRARQAPVVDFGPDPESAGLSGAEREKLLADGGAAGGSAAPLRAEKGTIHGASAALSRGDFLALAGVTLLALIVRCYRLEQPSSVVFDEVHFGGFAGQYVQQSFFMDVHPPLAKLLIALVAWLYGFEGHFHFDKIGNEYLAAQDGQERVPYVPMRRMNALFGVALVPVAYLTLRRLALRPSSALLGALLVTFENALTTQSRLILLDSPLVFFVGTSLFFWVSFSLLDTHAPFTRRWWVYLALTGLSLGAVVSCKWVGLFTIASVGLAVIVQLWMRLGDVRVPVQTVVKHFCARAVCLIGLPIVVYLTCFAVHLGVLQRHGTGDTFMSWAFRRTLRGNGIPDTYARVALGSTVTIQHYNTHGGYLHSHPHDYETGTHQQQITLYPYEDENNQWMFLEVPGTEEQKHDEDGHAIRDEDEVERHLNKLTYLEHGREVRLLHVATDKRLHSHDTDRPPVTDADYQDEVTGYGFPDFGGDVNDNWVIEIHKQERLPRHVDDNEVVALRTIFRLRHSNTFCYLFSHKVALPEWGFGQQEVTCNHSPTLPNSLWYIETNTHPMLPEQKDTPMINYLRPNFFAKFWELQKTMWRVNQHLTDRHTYESRPESWPFLRRGINFWTKHHRQVYLFGNPFVWWVSSSCVLAYMAVRVLLVLRAQRGFSDFANGTVVFYDRICGMLTVAWLLHYLPFYMMHRQLFIHHYLPALYCATLLTAAVFDAARLRLRPSARLNAALALAAIALLTFLRYAPIAYAGRWTGDACQSSILRNSWDFNCVDFPESKSAYAEYSSPVYDPEATPGHHGRLEQIGSQIGSFFRHSTEKDLKAAAPGHNVFSSTPAGASSAAPFGAVGSNATQGATSTSTAANVPHASGLDQAQMQKMVLQGTSAIAKDDRKSTTSSPPPKGAKAA